MLDNLGPLLGNVYGEFMEIRCLKAPFNYYAPFWSNRFSSCLWENLKTPISMISGFSDVPLAPQSNYFWKHQNT